MSSAPRVLAALEALEGALQQQSAAASRTAGAAEELSRLRAALAEANKRADVAEANARHHAARADALFDRQKTVRTRLDALAERLSPYMADGRAAGATGAPAARPNGASTPHTPQQEGQA